MNQLVRFLNALLFFEQNFKGEAWKKFVSELIESSIEKLADFLEIKPNSEIISFLGNTNQEYAVKTICRMMKNHSIQAELNECYDISRAFGRENLYKYHSKLINQELDDFLRSGDERLIKLGMAIREKI